MELYLISLWTFADSLFIMPILHLKPQNYSNILINVTFNNRNATVYNLSVESGLYPARNIVSNNGSTDV